MTVKELIEALQEHPEDRLVVWSAESSGYHDVRNLEVKAVFSRKESIASDLGRHWDANDGNAEGVTRVVCIW